MATATSGTFFPTARETAAGCATASIRPRCGLSIATTWRPRATATIWIRWRTYDGRGNCGTCGWLFLGNAGSDTPQGRRHLDAGRLFGRRRAQRDLSQSWLPCRGDRDHLRSLEDQLPDAVGILFPDPRSDDREPAGQRSGNKL